MSWSAPAVAKLKELWMEGISASLIAPQLSPLMDRQCTKNMVIGKVRRLGLAQRKTRVQKTQAGFGPRHIWTAEQELIVKQRWEEGVPWYTIAEELGIEDITESQIRSRANLLNGRRSRPARRGRRKPRLMEELDASYADLDFDLPPVEDRKSLIDVGRNECRFPIGEPEDPDFAVCARKTVDGQSYCASHYYLCHRITK